MALSDLAVYSEYAYTTRNEFLDYNINLFNQASQGTIRLQPSAHQGDYSDEVFWKKVAGGTVRRRNAYGSGAIAQKRMTQGVETSVKIAAGTPEMLFQPSDLTWIQLNPESAGIAFGQQLAMDSLADMFNTAAGCFIAGISGVPGKVLDISAASGDAAKNSFLTQADAAQLMGDRSSAILAWLMHSKPANDLLKNALTNGERLFSYGTVNVMRDPLGRVYIVSDAPALQGPSSTFFTLGLKRDAIRIGQNNDWYAAETKITGQENIQTTYQAEWTYNIGLEGFAWDKSSGSHSPNDAALFTAANWDKVVTSEKDVGGVLLKSK